MHRVLLFFCGLMFACAAEMNSSSGIYIRINQVAFLNDDFKTGIVLSSRNLDGIQFKIVDQSNGDVVFEETLRDSKIGYAEYGFTYSVDFSSIKKNGTYQAVVEKAKSFPFEISKQNYAKILPSLLSFYRVQRCGYTDPQFHEVCHKADATSVVDGEKVIEKTIDLTGGWHDAGDYTKFLNTTAYATYTLMFAYEFLPEVFDFDKNGNNTPDILEEAKVGLDWLLRCNFEKYKLISQVQDNRDHDVGWRMPEDDTLEYDRPVFVGMGKNLIGIYTAALALGARIWREKFQLNDFAAQCLTTAENLYSVHNRAPDVDKSGSGAYRDNNFEGKMALGAVELYNTTGRSSYLDDAIKFADSAGADYWWSYGDISSFAHYKLALNSETRFTEYIKTSLNHYSEYAADKLFGEGVTFQWGANNSLLGITLQWILYNRLTGSNEFKQLAINQRDYVMGKNPWGICFITNFGTRYSKNLHHQVSELLGIDLPGGFAAGPVKKKIVTDSGIQYSSVDNFSTFQTDSAYYRDDKMDYITNEPTIVANATALFVMGYFAK